MIRRVVVLGTTGAGKSTFAGRLADLIGAEHVELDAFNHGPNWTPRSPEEFAADVASVAARASWVVDGNYVDRVSGTLWPHADTVVWLDLPLWLVLPRIVRRTVRRIRNRTELWNGNGNSGRRSSGATRCWSGRSGRIGFTAPNCPAGWPRSSGPVCGSCA